MVRPHSGSPRSRQRYSDGSRSEHHGGRSGPASRGFRGPSGKAPPSWREGNNGGHSSYPRDKRPMMGEPRERPHGHWMPQHQNNFRPYPMSQESQRGRRRSPPSRSNHPSHVQHRQSPHGPSGHHRPFHGNNSSHFSPSRYFHSPPSDRRGPSPQNTFRPPQRYQNSPHEQERSWGPGRQPSHRERPLGRLSHRGQRWNGRGGYPHPNGDPRPSDLPPRKPREFYERNSYPERWSAERDPRRQHGEASRGRGRGRPGHHAPEWLRREGGNPYPRPPYRSPSWKSGPPSSSNSSSRFPAPPHPHERPPMRPMKRRIQEIGRLLPPEFEQGPPKRFRREMPVRPMPLKGFGGRGLSLKDKARLLKGRKFRDESVSRFKMPPPRPRPSDKMLRGRMEEVEHMGESSRHLPRKIPLRNSVKRQPPRRSPSDPDSKSADGEMDSERQVESRRSVRAPSSSPIDRQLTHDLVVVSHWEAGTRSSSPKSSTSWKSRMSHNDKLGENPDHRFGCSPRDQKQRRLMDGSGKMLRKPGPFPKPGFRPAPVLQKGSDGVIRRPLMAPTLTRLSLNQKPTLRKSQSIMTKYRNMQTLRHKAPPHPRQATSYRRW